MNKYSKIFVGLILLLAVFFYCRHEYAWSDKIISSQNKEWTVLSKDKTFYFLKPWTWFKQPIVTIEFIDSNYFGKFSNTIYFAHTKRLSRLDDPIEHEGIMMIDTKNKQFTYCSNDKDFLAIDLSTINDLNWLPYSKRDGGISDIVNYINNNFRKYTMLNFFGDEIDISNYISTKKYKLNTKDYNGFVPYIINYNPYEINDQDLQLIEKDFKVWLERHPEFNPKSDKIYKSQIKYKESNLFYRDIADKFTLQSVLKHKNIDTLISINFSFSKHVYPQSNTKNSILFEE